MKITTHSTDEAILEELGQRLAAARLDRNLTQFDLAEQAGVSKSTVQRLEQGATATQLSGFIRVCRVLGLVEQIDAFIPEPPVSPMAQLQQQGRKRRRASGKNAAPGATKKWTWGEPS